MKFAKRMLEEGLFRFYPHLRESVEHLSVATPLTNQHYLNSVHGECYGFDNTPARFSQFHEQFRPATRVNGLFLAGQDVCTIGVSGAMMSGVMAAHAVLGYGTLADIVLDRDLCKEIAAAHNISVRGKWLA